MKLSVIILNYNVQYFLEQCIISVQRAIGNIDAEIIVVDNNSLDGSCEMVKRVFLNINLIENKENIGFSKANNQAVKEAKGEYICILNPDTAVSENTFVTCFQEAAKYPKMGALGIYMLDGTGNFLPESKRNIPTPNRSMLKLIGLSRKRNSYYANSLSEDENGEVEVLAGAFMFVKRSIFEEVNGFDEDYFMYGEDIDISYKIMKAGYQNRYVGKTHILHYKGESTLKDDAYFNRFFGAMKIFYKKHFNTNPVFDSTVNLGLFMAKKMRKASANRTKPDIVVKQNYIFTENFNLLKRISEAMESPIKSVSKTKLQEEEITNSLLIFDVDYMGYSQIFAVMRKFKNKGNIFRIFPPKCNFMLGSDRSDEKGSVVVF